MQLSFIGNIILHVRVKLIHWCFEAKPNNYVTTSTERKCSLAWNVHYRRSTDNGKVHHILCV